MDERFIQKLGELIGRARLPIKHRARNALFHIEMAEKIIDIDPNMAALRMITAEEEAATAIMLSLKARKYKGADKLKHTNHIHKLAVHPFIQAMKPLFIELSAPYSEFGLRIMEFEKKEIVRIRVPYFENGVRTGDIYCIPPLNFVIAESGKPYNFEKEFSEFAKKKNHNKIKDYVEAAVKIRNALLYATDKGIARGQGPVNETFNTRKDRVLLMLCIYMMIDPYFKKQMFVQNCLYAFLKIVEAFPSGLAEEY
jgi:hypothetical protein